MKCTITRKNDLVVSKWSGGSTTQLFIYPCIADYARRDFEVRISSATIEETPSAFTNLPGFRRVLMPLNAPLRLVFENHGEAELNPFDSVEFDGAWNTVSHGVCTDFGIMLAAGWHGELAKAVTGEYKLPAGFMGVYALIEGIKVFVAGKEHNLMQGDFALLEPETGAELRLIVPEENAAVLIRIFPNARCQS
jgi:environmental stress-induced protein Ves